MTARAVGALAVTAALVLAVPAHATPADAGTALTAAVTANDLAGGVAVVGTGLDQKRYTAGRSDVATGAGFAPGTHLRVASITKTFVAATVLQLVAEGHVDLDAPLDRYLPGRLAGDGIDGGAITVRHLLRHQSGLPEYFGADTPIPTQPVTADQLLDMALRRPAQFPPATAMKYTNTNYIVAGLVIEAVTGAAARDEITRRIIGPLGLADTYFPAPGDTGLRTPFAHGYEIVDGRRTDVTAFNASAAGMSGELISTNEDTAVFVTALLDGRVVPQAQLRDMMDTVEHTDLGPGYRYGLGLAAIDLSCGVTVWGHPGGGDGYQSLMVKPFDGPRSPALSVTFTQATGAESGLEPPLFQVADALYC